MNELKPEEIKPKIKKSISVPKIKIDKEIEDYISNFDKQKEIEEFDKLLKKNKINNKKQEEIKPKTEIKKQINNKKEEIKPKTEIKKHPIVEEFETLQIPYIIYQYDNKLNETLTNFINKQVEKEKPVYDYLISSFFKEYNNDILKRISIDEYFKSLKYIVNTYNSDVDYIETFLDKEHEFIKPKGFNRENEFKIAKEKLTKYRNKLNQIEHELLKQLK